MKKFCLFALTALLFAACNNPSAEPEKAIRLSQDTLMTPYTGGEYTFSVTAVDTWTAACEESWIRLDATSGKAGTTEVGIKITVNKESIENLGRVTFTSGENKAVLTVIRLAKPAPSLVVTSDKAINTPKEGGTYTIMVEGNIKWSIASNASWAKVSKGVSQNNDNITVTVSAATTPETTTATITVAPYGEGKEAGEQIVTITRGGTDATSLTVDPTAIDAPAEGGNFTVNIESNARWRVYKSWDADWINIYGTTESVNNGSFGIIVEEATSVDPATAIITIEEVRSDGYTPVAVQVTVNREGKAAASLSVSPLKIDAPAAGGKYTIEIKSNYPWTASLTGVKMFSVDKTEGSGDATMIVTVKSSTEEKETTGTIAISSSFGGERAKVSIRRAAYEKPGFSVSATKKVYFSRGNLFYKPDGNKWSFPKLQYVYNAMGNRYMNEGYLGGEYDLFGWGTGKNPLRTSIDDNDYTYNEWGDNVIEGGANATWRTLTRDEWMYLLKKRPNADKLHALASIDVYHGHVILPDTWILPNGLSFRTYGNVATTYADANNYTFDEWQMMEDAGAIFLPAAGCRYTNDSGENEISGVAETGYYWTSTSHTGNGKAPAWFITFYADDGFDEGFAGGRNGMSVRLVQDAN